MASSKVMPSTSNSRNSDLSHHPHNHHHNHNQNQNHNHPSSTSSPMISDFSPNSDPMFRNICGDSPAMLDSGIQSQSSSQRKTVDDVWREIVGQRKECKLEAPDEMMTLEDFLAKAEELDEEDEFQDSKVPPPPTMATERLGGGSGGSGGVFGFDPLLGQNPYAPPPSVDVGGGRGKRRGGTILETFDKAAHQRQRRMIKNRESAARSRERKQAYQFELESLAMKLEEENEKLLREKAEWTKKRHKQIYPCYFHTRQEGNDNLGQRLHIYIRFNFYKFKAHGETSACCSEEKASADAEESSFNAVVAKSESLSKTLRLTVWKKAISSRKCRSQEENICN